MWVMVIGVSTILALGFFGVMAIPQKLTISQIIEKSETQREQTYLKLISTLEDVSAACRSQ